GELQALYFFSPRVGVGVSFADQYFSKDFASGWRLNTHTRMSNYMAVGHVFLTPQSTWQVYIPLGLGLAQTDFAMDFSKLGDSMNHFTYNGFAYYVGVGVEREVSERFSLGVEARYNGNKFHASSTRANGDHVTVYPRANFLSLLVRLIYRI
ncbi:MAG: outer membrane beta-barrel protein, partial [Elusimicrobiaceae bacterium]|nr:outer membrane beta-barrel protein [Elusimicrobiaceae bacterium]